MKETISQEKGQARIQELMEMFPELPRQVVIKIDYVREGVKHTPILDEIGRWAWPDAHAYFEFDYDEHSQEDVVGGVSRTPKQICFGKRKDMECAKDLRLTLDSRSPYEVQYEGGGRYWLYRDGEPIEEVYFLPCPQWFWKKTSSGKPMNLVIGSDFEQKFDVCVTSYCEFFKDNNQCRYCNMNPTGEHLAELGQKRLLMKREQDVYEAYMAHAQESRIEDVALIGGSFYNRSKEADLYVRFLEVVKRAMRDSGYECESIRVIMQAMEEEDQRRLKEAGATQVLYPMEVWDPKRFEIICPGKAKSVGRERWISSLLKAVEIFGWGEKVKTNFVVGVEMVPPFGFKAEEEAAESVLEGLHYMVSHGVAVNNQIFRGRPGAVLVQAPRPRIEYLLRLELEREKLHKQYNVVDPFPY